MKQKEMENAINSGAVSMTVEEAARKRNEAALGDTNAPGTISNAGVVGDDGKIVPFVKPSQREFEIIPAQGQPTRVVMREDPEAQAARIALIKAKVAPDATNTEFELLMYIANKYDLDPLLKEIWLVKFGNSPAQIYAGRDGYLKIAHRSGHFDGMETKVNMSADGTKIESATCTIWRNDMQHTISSHVLFNEYSTGKNLWATKPAVMIGKVAESVALRKAFSVAGLYSPEELGQ
jgi:phage recombination protein Bet